MDRTLLDVWSVLFLGGPGTPPLVPKESVRKALIAEAYDLCLPCRIWNYILIMTLHIRY